MAVTSTFPEAYRRLLAPVRAKCRRLLGQTAAAEDAAQEAFARLLSSGPPLDGSSDTRTIMAWLYLTATRISMDVLRQKRGAVDLDAIEHVACSARPDDVVAARSSIAALSNEVPAEEVEAALLARVDGLSQPEVALVLGVSERTVRRLLTRFDERAAELRKEVVK
jgi:RNA polymerase sigma factor (sigma-70 family)